MLIQLRSEEDPKNIIEQGFTLVELLIVIVILGILAGIVVFAVSNLTDTASKNGCATEASTVETAAEAFKTQALRYPTSLNELTTTQTINGNSVGPFLKSSPKALNTTAVDVKNQFRVTWYAAGPPVVNFAVTRPADNSCTA